MRTAREIFQETRQQKKISLESVAEKTKIPFKYLKGIELGDNASFPDFHYAQLYVRGYAQFLGLSSQKMVSLFRRDWQGDWKTGRVKRRKYFLKLIDQLPFGTGSSLVVLSVVLLVGGYLLRQYITFNSPPPLEVEISCLPDKILIEGKTNFGVVVRVDGKTTSLSEKGEFKEEIISPWPERIVVQAESPAGKIREEIVETKCR